MTGYLRKEFREQIEASQSLRWDIKFTRRDAVLYRLEDKKPFQPERKVSPKENVNFLTRRHMACDLNHTTIRNCAIFWISVILAYLKRACRHIWTSRICPESVQNGGFRRKNGWSVTQHLHFSAVARIWTVSSKRYCWVQPNGVLQEIIFSGMFCI